MYPEEGEEEDDEIVMDEIDKGFRLSVQKSSSNGTKQ